MGGASSISGQVAGWCLMITASGSGHRSLAVERDRLQPLAMTVVDRPFEPVDDRGVAQVGEPERATQQGFLGLGR